jgi:hypothetical protein
MEIKESACLIAVIFHLGTGLGARRAGLPVLEWTRIRGVPSGCAESSKTPGWGRTVLREGLFFY